MHAACWNKVCFIAWKTQFEDAEMEALWAELTDCKRVQVMQKKWVIDLKVVSSLKHLGSTVSAHRHARGLCMSKLFDSPRQASSSWKRSRNLRHRWNNSRPARLWLCFVGLQKITFLYVEEDRETYSLKKAKADTTAAASLEPEQVPHICDSSSGYREQQLHTSWVCRWFFYLSRARHEQ